MEVVIFVGGVLRPGKAIGAAIARAELVLAADSGAETALAYGCVPSIVVGDFDSLTIPMADLEARGCQLLRASREKDETDTELAIQVALEHGATSVTLLGGIEGQRFDHTVANVLLLAAFPIPIRMVDGPTICQLLRGPAHMQLHAQAGDLLSLFPLTSEAGGVETHGLSYPLHKETLCFGRPRGVSNVFQHEEARVSVESGLLLVIQTSVEELHAR